jgi:hypothetical protein
MAESTNQVLQNLFKEGWFEHPQQEDPRWMLLVQATGNGRTLKKLRMCCCTDITGNSPCKSKVIQRLAYIRDHVNKCCKFQNQSDQSLQILEDSASLYGKYLNITVDQKLHFHEIHIIMIFIITIPQSL